MKFFKTAILFSMLILQNNIFANNLTPREIMWNVINKYSVTDELQEIKMTLINKEGRTWERRATFYIKEIDKDNDKILFLFHSPADLAGSGVLTIENKHGEDDQWMYVPAYHTARRIPSANRSDQYMGTDFYYEDVITPRVEEYDYQITGKEKIDKTDCLVITGIPISERLKKESGYGKIVSYVDTEKFVILKQNLYSKKDGTLIKQLINANLNNYNGILRWGQRKMTTLSTGHSTVVEYTKQDINKGISDEYFTLRYLKRGK